MLTASRTTQAARRALQSTTARRQLATAVETPAFKIAARQNGQPTASVTVVVKAGSRFEPAGANGAAHVLKNFAFKGTSKRSALRTVRESELYGGVLSATVGREHLALTAEFLKGDEEYFVDVLSSVVTSTAFAPHELHEIVAPQVEAESLAASADPSSLALEAAHALAFRNGLGNPIFATAPVPIDTVKSFASDAFTQSNIAIISSGIDESVIKQLVQSKLSSLPSGSSASTSKSQYFGGETRIPAHGTNTLFIGFGTSTPSSALSVLAAHLDPTPSVKWTEGSSPLASLPSSVTAQVVHEPYSDGALFGVLLQGENPEELKTAGKTAVQAIKGAAGALKGDALTKATAKAQYSVASMLEGARDVSSAALAHQLFSGATTSFDGLKEGDVSKAAQALTGAKATYVAVGNVSVLPYGDELGL